MSWTTRLVSVASRSSHDECKGSEVAWKYFQGRLWWAEPSASTPKLLKHCPQVPYWDTSYILWNCKAYCPECLTEKPMTQDSRLGMEDVPLRKMLGPPWSYLSWLNSSRDSTCFRIPRCNWGGRGSKVEKAWGTEALTSGETGSGPVEILPAYTLGSKGHWGENPPHI